MAASEVTAKRRTDGQRVVKREDLRIRIGMGKEEKEGRFYETLPRACFNGPRRSRGNGKGGRAIQPQRAAPPFPSNLGVGERARRQLA